MEQLQQKVDRTKQALADVWGIDGHNTEQVAHVLAIMLSALPRAVSTHLQALHVPFLSASNVLNDLERELTQPLSGASIVAQVGLSFKQYRTLVALLGRNPETHRPLTLPSGLSAGRLLPSRDSVHSFWKAQIAAVRGLQTIEHAGLSTTLWPVQQILNYIFSHPLLASFLIYDERIDLVRRMDEYPQAGQGVFVESYTLRNFGHLSKVLLFQFVSIISECTSHSHHLETLLQPNNLFLEQALASGQVTIVPSSGSPFSRPFSLRIGGDDPMLRYVLRRQSSQSEFCCLYCLWIRLGPSTQDASCLRVATVRAACSQITSAGGYSNAAQTDPMVRSLQPYDTVFCVLHALARIGDLIVDLLYDFVAAQSQPAPLFVLLNTVFRLEHIRVALLVGEKPAQGWNIKGCHAAVLLKIFPRIAQALDLDQAIVACVSQVRRLFHVMYIFDPALPEHAQDVAWFDANVDQIMLDFRRLVARGHETNYIHEIQKHASALLHHGGLAAFSGDTHETLQCLLKEAYHSWTPRGGCGSDTLRLVWERWFMQLHVLVLSGHTDAASVPGLKTKLHATSLVSDLLSLDIHP